MWCFVAAARKAVVILPSSNRTLECSQWSALVPSVLRVHLVHSLAGLRKCARVLIVSLLCGRCAPELAAGIHNFPQGFSSQTPEAGSQFCGTEERDLP